MNPATSRPTARPIRNSSRRLTRRGYTLLEMVISTGAATVLLGGLMSTIVVANRAWSPDLKPAIKTEASGLTRQLSIDLRSALGFTERTATAVTFTVPDRDSDGQPDVLRYAWSGIAGDPLTVSLNGGTAQVVVADVQTFNMDYLLRSVTAPVIPTNSQNLKVVFISEADAGKAGEVDRSKLATEDQQRIAAIESWGFTVLAVSGYASDADWVTAIDKAAAVYVPGSVEDVAISKRLYHANAGVVFESSCLRDESGFATQKQTTSTTNIDLENTFHYITSTLEAGSIPIVSSSQPLLLLRPGLGPDVEVLARSTLRDTYNASLAVLEANARTHLEAPVPARRVLLPWGASSTAFDQLTTSALTIMERSIKWAAMLNESVTQRRVLYFVDDASGYNQRMFDLKIMLESAGLEVRLVNQTSSADVIATEISQSQAIYLTYDMNSEILLDAVNNATQGVISEGISWTVPLGFSENVSKGSVTTVGVKEKDHEILAGFNGSSITVLTGNASHVTPGGNLANGALTILETDSSGKGSALSALTVIEKGDRRIDDTAAPGRRTLIPYYNTLRADLTDDGYRLIQQAVDWTTRELEPVVIESSGSQSFSKFLQSLSK